MCGMISLKYYVEYGYYMEAVVYNTPVPYSDTDTVYGYYTEGFDIEEYTVFYYDFMNFQEVLKYTFPKMSRWRRWLTRGFTDGQFIYALNKSHLYSKIKHDRLLKHEVAHIEKKGVHRWWVPDLMHPTWLFRWSNKIW